MLRVLVFIFVLCGSAVTGETASSLEELKNDYMNIALQCLKENPLKEDEIRTLHEKDMTDNPSVKCFFACAYKKTGMMDENGYFSIEGVRTISERYIAEDPDIVRKSDQYTDACKSVNDVPVSDGNKGCERAALIYKCALEKAPDFGFVA